jgi:hypothetical protein
MVNLIKIYLPSKLINESKKHKDQIFKLYGSFKESNEILEIFIKNYSLNNQTKSIGTFIYASTKKQKVKKNSSLQLELDSENNFICNYKEQATNYFIFLCENKEIFTFNKQIDKKQETKINW